MDIQFVKRASCLLAATTVLAGATSYLTTKLMAQTALDRQEPKIMKKAGDRIAGAAKDSQIRRMQVEAGQRLLEAPTEEISLTAFDGIRLVGHWYPCDRPERIFIAMHGWRSTWYRDFGIISEFLHANHCSLLLAEQRGQNNSGGDVMGFGVTERYDCLRWAQWVSENKAGTLPIYLCGVSMGATTVLMASGMELPESVHGIVADCGFTSPDAIWNHVANENLHIRYRALRRSLAEAFYERKTRTEDFQYSTTDALRVSHTPVLFIHGTDDHFVPVEMTYENYLACAAPKRLLIVPGADHGLSYLVERERYEAAIKEFWKDFDGPQP